MEELNLREEEEWKGKYNQNQKVRKEDVVHVEVVVWGVLGDKNDDDGMTET